MIPLAQQGSNDGTAAALAGAFCVAALLVPVAGFLGFLAYRWHDSEANRLRKVAEKAEAAARKNELQARREAQEATIKADMAKAEAQQHIDLALNKIGKVDAQLAEMGAYIVGEQFEMHHKKIKADNYGDVLKRIHRSWEVADKNGYEVPEGERNEMTRILSTQHELAIRAQREKEKQAIIKEQIREEEKRAKEAAKAIKEAEKEEAIRRQALEDAREEIERNRRKEEARIADLMKTNAEAAEKLRADLAAAHAAEVAELERELAEAEAKALRTKSMAEQTKAGHIYVISNIGSFGKGVFKVGMTRRLEPMERVWELGDASVPFEFDVHAMVSTTDAPGLEYALHSALESRRVNKVNLRKEFFRVDLAEIIAIIQRTHGEVTYTADPEALEYLETLAIERGEAAPVASSGSASGND